jgi:hypothetical protein
MQYERNEILYTQNNILVEIVLVFTMNQAKILTLYNYWMKQREVYDLHCLLHNCFTKLRLLQKRTSINLISSLRI